MNNLEFAARYHQDELLEEARQARLARQAGVGNHAGHHHRLTAAIVSVLMLIALVALI